MGRKMMDCRQIPSQMNCTLTISGEEEEVLDESVQHAVRVHQEEDTPELRTSLRASLVDEPDALRAPSPMSGAETQPGL